MNRYIESYNKIYQKQQESQSNNITRIKSQLSQIPFMKNRYNFASLHGGARILEKNNNCASSKSILDDNSDNYMFNTCANKEKFMVIRLSEDILLDSFGLINREFYSSNLKDFNLYGSVYYPNSEWIPLGNYTALDIREMQYFQNSETWVRFLKFEFLSHYNDEYYCTISQIQVFGNTMLQSFDLEFKQQEHVIKNIKSNITNQQNIKVNTSLQFPKESVQEINFKIEEEEQKLKEFLTIQQNKINYLNQYEQEEQKKEIILDKINFQQTLYIKQTHNQNSENDINLNQRQYIEQTFNQDSNNKNQLQNDFIQQNEPNNNQSKMYNFQQFCEQQNENNLKCEQNIQIDNQTQSKQNIAIIQPPNIIKNVIKSLAQCYQNWVQDFIINGISMDEQFENVDYIPNHQNNSNDNSNTIQQDSTQSPHQLLFIQDDIPYESIFKKLSKHIKILELNQIILQKFITSQEKLNLDLTNQVRQLRHIIDYFQNLKQKQYKHNNGVQDQQIFQLNNKIKYILDLINDKKDWTLSQLFMINFLCFLIYKTFQIIVQIIKEKSLWMPWSPKKKFKKQQQQQLKRIRKKSSSAIEISDIEDVDNIDLNQDLYKSASQLKYNKASFDTNDIQISKQFNQEGSFEKVSDKIQDDQVPQSRQYMKNLKRLWTRQQI